jgi:putative N6-adenine-specific DNA methylase
MAIYEQVATTLKGLEEVLADEIFELGGQDIEVLKRAVRYNGSDEILYKANLKLRTALRVLVPIYSFIAENEQDLYREIHEYPWENLMDNRNTFAIDAIVSGTTFTHSQYVALKTKDAIVDRFRNKTGERPSIDTKNPDLKINIHVNRQEISVSLDSTGISLDRRGYRTNANEAPINEALAAGIILLSGWDKKAPFLDPMAGSGTFSIEAAYIAANIPPGINRSFAFERWPDFNERLFDRVYDELKNQIVDPECKFFCSDITTESLGIIANNASNAGVEEYIQVKEADFFESSPSTENGFIFLNPPYGERLSLDNIKDFYERIGDTLKQRYAGFEAWIISSDHVALKVLGLRADKKIDLMNGGLDARLQQYKMFEGRMKE